MYTLFPSVNCIAQIMNPVLLKYPGSWRRFVLHCIAPQYNCQLCIDREATNLFPGKSDRKVTAVTLLYLIALYFYKVHYTALQCTDTEKRCPKWSSVHWIALQCTEVHCSALTCTAVNCSSLHWKGTGGPDLDTWYRRRSRKLEKKKNRGRKRINCITNQFHIKAMLPFDSYW